MQLSCRQRYNESLTLSSKSKSSQVIILLWALDQQLFLKGSRNPEKEIYTTALQPGQKGLHLLLDEGPRIRQAFYFILSLSLSLSSSLESLTLTLQAMSHIQTTVLNPGSSYPKVVRVARLHFFLLSYHI